MGLHYREVPAKDICGNSTAEISSLLVLWGSGHEPGKIMTAQT